MRNIGFVLLSLMLWGCAAQEKTEEPVQEEVSEMTQTSDTFEFFNLTPRRSPLLLTKCKGGDEFVLIIC